jgi:hypothetical protein
MKQVIAYICVFIMILGALYSIYYMQIHAIDLAWNAKYIDPDLVDTNGIITQDLNTMYSRGVMILVFSPMVFLILIVMAFLIGTKVGGSNGA